MQINTKKIKENKKSFRNGNMNMMFIHLQVEHFGTNKEMMKYDARVWKLFYHFILQFTMNDWLIFKNIPQQQQIIPPSSFYSFFSSFTRTSAYTLFFSCFSFPHLIIFLRFSFSQLLLDIYMFNLCSDISYILLSLLLLLWIWMLP